MVKLLAVLVNYGNEQLSYLQQVVNELKSFHHFDVTIIVNSNIELDIEGIDHVNIIELDDYQLLPLTCRETIWDYRFDYEVFLFGENDHLFKEEHLANYIKYSTILPKDRIAGLIQYEENENGKYYPAYHADYDWDYDSVEEYKGFKFAHFTNVHQASFILTQYQLLNIGRMHDFTKFFDTSNFHIYSEKCKVNTDIYQFCGMKKMICINEFDSNLIHHLPNIYINGDLGRLRLGSYHQKMQEAINKIL